VVQHAFVVNNPQGPEPVRIEPHQVNVYRNDQNLLWKILAQGWGWSPNYVPPIEILDEWTGTAPAPIGGEPEMGELDRRVYSAHGPGPNMGDEAVVYKYIAWVTDDPGFAPESDRRLTALDFSQVPAVPIDPEIGNQPQP
jgi:hypothetical protein